MADVWAYLGIGFVMIYVGIALFMVYLGMVLERGRTDRRLRGRTRRLGGWYGA